MSKTKFDSIKDEDTTILFEPWIWIYFGTFSKILLRM